MSTPRVKYMKQFFPIASYSQNDALKQVSVTANGHILFAGLPITLTAGKSYDATRAIVFSTAANTFIANCNTTIPEQLDSYVVDGYLTGQVGGQSEFSIPRGTGAPAVVQSFVRGTGGATYNLEASLDSSHWISLANVSHATVTNNTAYNTVTAGFAFVRANVVSIGANTNLVIMLAE